MGDYEITGAKDEIDSSIERGLRDFKNLEIKDIKHKERVLLAGNNIGICIIVLDYLSFKRTFEVIFHISIFNY